MLLLLAAAACTEPAAPPLVVDSDDFRAARPVELITATNLGVLPGDNQSLAWGVNNQGQAVGHSVNAAGWFRAFLWQSGGITDITPPGREGSATAINNAIPAQAAGSLSASGSSQNRAIRWTLTPAWTFEELETEPSSASGINDNGTVAGNVCVASCVSGGDWRGAIWPAPGAPGSRVTIDPLAGFTYSNAYDINNAGDVVGTSSRYGATGPDYRAYIRRPDGSMIELLPLSGEATSQALALSEPNLYGEVFVAGLSATATSQSAVRWTVSSAGVVTDYVGTSGWADGAHNAGHVAGTTLGRKQYAFLWRNGQIEKLPPVRGGSSTAVRGMDRGVPGGAIWVAGETRVHGWPRATIWTIAD